jgi:hypothetical protein
MKYLWSDAWLLEAIIYANKGGQGTLDRILVCADGINHTLILEDELESGLARLTAGGLICETEGCFSATELLPRKMIRKIGENTNKDLQTLERYLQAEPRNPAKNARDPRNKLKYPGLTRNRLAEADRLASAYLAKARNALPNTGKK